MNKVLSSIDIPRQSSGAHDVLEQPVEESFVEAEVQPDPSEDLQPRFEEALTNRDEATLAVIADLEAKAERARFAEELGPTVNSIQEVSAEEPAQHPLYPPAQPPISRPPRELGPYTQYKYISAPEIQTPPQDAKGAFGRIYNHIRQRYEKRQRRKQEQRRGREQEAELTHRDPRLDAQLHLGLVGAAFAIMDQRKPYWME